MASLDIRTLLVVISLLMFARAGVLVLVYYSQRQYLPVRSWALGSSLVAFGALVVVLRGVIPLWVSVLVGQACVLTGWAFLNAGFLLAAQHRPPRGLIRVVIVISLLALAWYVVVDDNYQARTLVTSLVTIGFDLYTAAHCLRYRNAMQKQQRVLNGVGAMLITTALVNALKLWFVMESSVPVLLVYDWRNVLFYTVTALYCVVGTSLSVLLAALHVESRLKKVMAAQVAAQEQVRNVAFFDPLTQLPNRRLLEDRLRQAVSQAKRDQTFGALLMIDLDNFKPLNDAHGHDAGDLLLQDVAHRLRSCLREVDTAARVGGDEYVVVLSGLAIGAKSSREQALALADKVRLLLAAPYVLTVAGGAAAAAIEHRCTASIGVTLFQDGTGAEILKRADSAMYAAKHAGRNTVCFGGD